MKVALCQLYVSQNKEQNIENAYNMLKKAHDGGADMAILPEMFCIKYKPSLFLSASEKIPGGMAYDMLCKAANDFSMHIIGGSVPELCDGKLYNTSMCFDNSGNLAGTYRKAHLFDVVLPDFRFMESDTISRGDNPPLIIDAPMKTGVSICFDIRFPEWSRMMMLNGAEFIALPAAFSLKTGPRHWELLLRARAVDNQCFVAGVSPATSDSAYGHSMLISPDGDVLCDLGEKENMQIMDIDSKITDNARREIPISTARRTNLYEL